MGKKPVAIAVLVCDKVITEEGTKKKSLIGIFENIASSKFPCVHYFLSVYIKLADAFGPYKFSLELISLDSGTVLNRVDMPREIEITDPLRAHELVFNMGGLKFPSPGRYEFRVLGNGEAFGQKTFLVEGLRNKKSENNS